MSANGISRLEFKRDRQLAKLNLAKQKRLAQSNPRSYFDITQLPAIYAENNNDTNSVIDNPNLDGLIIGRPWISLAPPVANGNLVDQSYVYNTGNRTIDAGADFVGAQLTYSLLDSVSGVSIDSNTGIITVSTNNELTSTLITLIAANSSGTAFSSFNLEVVIPLGSFSWDSNTQSPGPAT
jgi:hypothetical protein